MIMAVTLEGTQRGDEAGGADKPVADGAKEPAATGVGGDKGSISSSTSSGRKRSGSSGESPELKRARRHRSSSHSSEVEIDEVVSPFGNTMTIRSSEMSVIRGIIEYMNQNNVVFLSLPASQNHLKKEGKKIDRVHPLCFIWTIVSSPTHRAMLKSFRDGWFDGIKWQGFLGTSVFHNKGFSKNMESVYGRRSFDDCKDDFAAFYIALNLKPEVMDPYVQNKKWVQFTSALLENSSYKQ